MKSLDQIKLIALDLDGTTLTREGLTRRTRETLEEAINRGFEVVIATGRPYVALPEKVLNIIGLKHIIISNGAHIVDLKGRFLYSNYVDREAILPICALMEKSPFPVEVFTEGAAFVDQRLYDELAEKGSTFMSAKYVLRTRRPVPDIYEFWRENSERIENINIHFEFQEDRHRMWERFGEFQGITVTSSQHNNIEIGGATTSKATALAHLCREKGISMENVMAFGDSPNDCTMLRDAGFGVAMANGVEEIKELADFITLSNDEEGVCYAIRRLLFKEEDGVAAPKRGSFLGRILKNIRGSR